MRLCALFIKEYKKVSKQQEKIKQGPIVKYKECV